MRTSAQVRRVVECFGVAIILDQGSEILEAGTVLRQVGDYWGAQYKPGSSKELPYDDPLFEIPDEHIDRFTVLVRA